MENLPLISVVIPCYNHGAYIAEAIDSVRAQTYPRFEIIVVNDGSTDNSESVIRGFPEVQYIWQVNMGLSAARNTGIKCSKGEYLVFLDADDWLYPDALYLQYRQISGFPDIAFVSGAHDKVDNKKNLMEEEVAVVPERHYSHLLQGNYIGMHAAVMYRKQVFHHFLFDTFLEACEDYDLYLKIARIFPVLHHQGKIAAYRFHNSNMSANVSLMLDRVLFVLKRQQKFLISRSEREAFQKGIRNWKDYYLDILAKQEGEQGIRNYRKALWKFDKARYLREKLKGWISPLPK